ncbi:MAG: DUF4846 domain-containing protein [Thermodesulfobacteriota bacterium]
MSKAFLQARLGLPLPVLTALIFFLVLLGAESGWIRAASPETGLPDYPWLKSTITELVALRIEPPKGFTRIPLENRSFGVWLRGLPLRPNARLVWLHNGLPKLNQSAHFAVLEVDVGEKDLQQCADAIIRLRAEYLRSQGCDDAISFHFTSGDLASWPRWRDGERPRVQGNKVSWTRSARQDGSYSNFRKYLDIVFTYAGTISLSKELQPVKNPARVEVGDVFIQSGSPGHAVLVVDVAANASGERAFLLAQSYIPAQDVHILRNPGSQISPWYTAKSAGELLTPEWTFRYEDLKRFPAVRCGGPRSQVAH